MLFIYLSHLASIDKFTKFGFAKSSKHKKAIDIPLSILLYYLCLSSNNVYVLVSWTRYSSSIMHTA